MSFAEIFNSYSTKVSSESRSKVLAAHPDVPGNVLYTLSNVLEEEKKAAAAAESAKAAAEALEVLEELVPDGGGLPDLPGEADNLPSDDMSAIMGGLANLDTSPETPAPPTPTPTAQPIARPAAPEPEPAQTPDGPSIFEEEPSPEGDGGMDDFDIFGGSGEAADNFPAPMDFPLNLEAEETPIDDAPSPQDNDLFIESPEDLWNAPAEAEAGGELPDFSATEMEEPSEPAAELPPAAREETAFPFSPPQESPSFDLWARANGAPADDFSRLDLNEEQIFIVREKINSIRDKNLRFELRNIIIEPEYHAAYYDELLTLLLVDTPEEKLSAFLAEILDPQETKQIAATSIARHARATFFADDVENYEHFKEDFTRTVKRVSAVAAILITVSVILWTTIAQPLRIENLYRRGLTAIREEKFTEGESMFNRAQQIAGRPNLKWHLEFGKVYENKQLLRLAEQKYRAALVIAPKNIPAAKQVAAFYTNIRPPDYNAAVGIFSKLASIYPSTFDVWDFYGKIYMSKGDFLAQDIIQQNEAYFSAAGVYRDFIIKNINNTAPYYRLMDIYIKLDSIEKIKQIYSLIDQLDPKDYNIEVLARLAGYYIDRKELTEAERIFRRMIPYIDKNISRLPDFQKKLQKAYNIDKEVISNVLSSAYYEFARYNMLSSDVPRAIRLLTNALMFSPSNGQVYNLLGEAFLIAKGGDRNRIAEAKKNFDTAAKLNPTNYKPQVNLGHIYFYYEQEGPSTDDAYARSLYHYRLAQNLKPSREKNFLLNYNAGWLEYRNGNYNDALAQWSDIYKDEPSNPILSYALGSVLYQMNNPRLSQVEFQKAAGSYSRVMDVVGTPSLSNPRHVEVFSQMARVRNNIGVINANYAAANPGQRIRYEKEALLNFYAAKDSADRIRQIYNNAEYNILTLTHPAIAGRATEFDNSVPKSSTLNNKDLEFQKHILEQV